MCVLRRVLPGAYPVPCMSLTPLECCILAEESFNFTCTQAIQALTTDLTQITGQLMQHNAETMNQLEILNFMTMVWDTIHATTQQPLTVAFHVNLSEYPRRRLSSESHWDLNRHTMSSTMNNVTRTHNEQRDTDKQWTTWHGQTMSSMTQTCRNMK